MKQGSVIFLQTVIVLIGVGALAFMLWFPHVEGRNANATLSQIYFNDPFLAYAYVASLPFFWALYQVFTLLRYIGQNKVFSQAAVNTLRTIKYCAMALVAFIVGAALYIRIFHAKDDDPVGFIAIAILATFTSIVIATAAAVFERLLQNAVDIKSENDLTV